MYVKFPGFVSSAILLLFASCSSTSLTVYTDYFTHEDLASYYVRTPDPLLNCPPVGQRFLVSWVLPSNLMKRNDVFLNVQLRMRNMEQLSAKVNISRRRIGNYLYEIYDKDYGETGGILTYKVELIAGDCVYKQWIHQLWAELIKFDSKSPTPLGGTLDEFDLPSDEEIGTDFELEEINEDP